MKNRTENLTMEFELRTPNSKLKTICQERSSFDEVLSQVESYTPRKVLFWGEGAGRISSYAAGWIAGRRGDVVVLDGANRFDPYMVSSFARKVLTSPERLLKKIRIARAFTCYQMATLIEERLVSLLEQQGEIAQQQRPWVILLGLTTPFLDEDVSEREVRPLFERSLRKVEAIAAGGIPFFLFQPFASSEHHSLFNKRGAGRLTDSKRTYLTKRLFQFSDLIWRIQPDNQGPRVVLEKIPKNFPCHSEPGPEFISGSAISESLDL